MKRRTALHGLGDRHSAPCCTDNDICAAAFHEDFATMLQIDLLLGRKKNFLHRLNKIMGEIEAIEAESDQTIKQ